MIHRSGSYFKTLFFRSFLRNENVATSGAGFEKCGRDSEERIPLRLERGRGGPYAHASVRGEDIKTPVLIKKTVVTRARSLYSVHTDRATRRQVFFFASSTRRRRNADARTRRSIFYFLLSKELKKSVMILPQVHLRKPCYDFYFL